MHLLPNYVKCSQHILEKVHKGQVRKKRQLPKHINGDALFRLDKQRGLYPISREKIMEYLLKLEHGMENILATHFTWRYWELSS